MASMDRRSFDTGVSAQVQGDLMSIIGRLESLIGQRQNQVGQAMSDFQADGVSDEYHAVEQRWTRAATEVRQIIDLVKATLTQDDQAASTALSRARAAVQAIG